MAEETNTSQQALSVATATATATMAQAIKAREQVVQDVMSEIPEDERGKLMTIAIDNTLGNRLSFVDGLILFSLMIQIGIASIHSSPFNFLYNLKGKRGKFRYTEHGSFEIDAEGRIIRFEYGTNGNGDHHFPASIGRLERLTDLSVYQSISLPVEELCNLPYLKTLRFNECSDVFDNFPVEMELNNLKRLYLYLCEFQSSSSLFFSWMSKQLSNLEHIDFHHLKQEQLGIVLDALHGNNFSFQDKLKNIRMNNCGIDDNRLATILLEILPTFSKVSSLDLGENYIESVQPTIDRIVKNDNTWIISKSILCLNLNGNPIMEKIKKDSKENKALTIFLQFFNSIYNLSGSKKSDYGSGIEYALRINHAGGRTIVAEDGSGSSYQDGNKTSALPFSVWPTVLERSYEKAGHIYQKRSLMREEKNATGLYDLVRNSGLSLLMNAHRPYNILRGDGNDKSSGDSDQSPTSSSALSALFNGDDDIGKKKSLKRKHVEVLETTIGIGDNDEKNNIAASTSLSTTDKKNHPPSSKHSCPRR